MQEGDAVTPPVTQSDDLPPVTDQDEGAVVEQQDKEVKPQKRQRPLKEVADDLRRNLKGQIAAQVMNAALEEATKSVRDHQYKMYDAADTAFSAGKKFEHNDFTKFDGSEIAKRLGLRFMETGLFVEDQYDTTELAKLDTLFSMQFQQVFPPSLYSQASHYDPTEPLLVRFGAVRLVMWFAEKHDARVRTLEEAKDDVIAFWKHNLAFEAAMHDAQKAAEEVSTSKKPLSDRFAERAKLTGQFSWYSSDMRFGLSRPVGVDSPGEEFMETVFSMKEGSVAVSHNANKSTVYLVKVISTDRRSGDDMNREFITRVSDLQMLPMDVQTVTGNYLMQLTQDFNNEVIDEYKIEWVEN